MTPEPAPTPPPFEPSQNDPDKMSEAGRLAGVFFSPGKAFADIARRPRWWVPLILSAILSTIFINAFTQRVGWESVIRSSIERLPNAQSMSPEQRERTITSGAKFYQYVGYGGPVIGALFFTFVIAVILMFIFDTIL